jgi:hypothetical protein
MAERNRCFESGCPGFCCQDIDLEATKFERRRVFPKAQRVQTLREIEEAKGKNPGVFFSRIRRKHLGNSGFVIVSINGGCPNRRQDGTCIEHDEREHAARNFVFGNFDCNAIRAEHDLPPVFVEPVE